MFLRSENRLRGLRQFVHSRKPRVAGKGQFEPQSSQQCAGPLDGSIPLPMGLRDRLSPGSQEAGADGPDLRSRVRAHRRGLASADAVSVCSKCYRCVFLCHQWVSGLVTTGVDEEDLLLC